MRIASGLLLLTVLLFGCAGAGEEHQAFQLYLVRHAEKQADVGQDPHLTNAGHQRARKLANYLQDKSISGIWSSDYFRTRETALPLAESLGIHLTIYDPHDLEALAKKLLKAGNNAYVVGHSNTTPELARLLCECDVEDMDESEHGRLIIISVAGRNRQITTLQQDELSK